jgi:hypothetical protein
MAKSVTWTKEQFGQTTLWRARSGRTEAHIAKAPGQPFFWDVVVRGPGGRRSGSAKGKARTLDAAKRCVDRAVNSTTYS